MAALTCQRPARVDDATAAGGTEEAEMPFVSVQIVREALASDPQRKKAAITDKVASAISEAAGRGED